MAAKSKRVSSTSAARHEPAAPHALGETQLRAVADLFAVLSEPSRLRILQLLQAGPASVSEVVERLGLKQANASKQLGILHRAGVLTREQRGLHAVYSIRMRLVFDLCALVCGRLQEEATAYAEALGG
jgi:DNA-binding transcriptional ArsR family regulator